MKTNQCELCGEHASPVAEQTCYDCGKRTCEECGRTDTRNAGTIRMREVWQCNECEFGGHP